MEGRKAHGRGSEEKVAEGQRIRMTRRIRVVTFCSVFFLSCLGALAATTDTAEHIVSVGGSASDPDYLDLNDGDNIAEDAIWGGVGIETIEDVGARSGRSETMLGMCAQHYMDKSSDQVRV